MMYSHSGILEHTENFESSGKLKIIAKIIQLWSEHKKMQILKSFDEVEPNVFVLKQEITDRIKLKAKKLRLKNNKRGNTNE